MSPVRQWLTRRVRRSRSRPNLDEALLFGRQRAYAWYRLRFLVIRSGLRTVLHVLEILLFALVVWPEFLPYFLVLRSGTAVFSGLYWGWLEQMRAETRQQWQKGDSAGVRMVIDRWLKLALVVVALQLLAMGGYLKWFPSPFTSFSILDAYIIACFVRLGLDTLARTFHAGIFAVRRVYRPLFSLLAGDLADVMAVLLLIQWLGPWSFAPALIVGGVVRNAFALYYTRRAYQRTRVPALRWRLFLRHSLPRFESLLPAFKHAAANFTLQLDAWLIMALVAADSGNRGHMFAATLFHLFRPLFGAGAVWARVFYFDFKRLQTGSFDLLRERFERFMRSLAWIASAAIGALLIVIAPLLLGPRLRWEVLALLLPFISARSLLALYQVQAFSYERYGHLLLIGLGAAALLLSVSFLPTDLPVTLALLGIGLFAIVLLVRAPRHAHPPDRAQGTLRGFAAWLTELAAARGPVRVWIAQCERRLMPAGRVGRALVSGFPEARFTRFGRNRLLWYAPAAIDTDLFVNRLIVQSAGCLSALWTGPVGANGVTAWREAAARLPAGDPLRALGSGLAVDPSRLLARFQQQFPEGTAIGSGSPTSLIDLSVRRSQHDRRLRRCIVRELRRLAAGGGGGRTRAAADDPLDITVFCPQGEPRLIFCLPRTIEADARTEWRRFVEQATASASLQGAAG